jgi:hypothetical protein
MSPSALLELEEKSEEFIDLAEMSRVVDTIYAIDVSAFKDEHFAVLERIIDRAVAVLGALPNGRHRPLIERLLQAREGVEQGMAPDPAQRPSLEDLSRYVAAHLG